MEKATATIYESRILPIVTRCCLVNLYKIEAQKPRLESLDNPLREIINENSQIVTIKIYK